ncbi:hypothetical protein GN956_G23158 [Arapaima gigas]
MEFEGQPDRFDASDPPGCPEAPCCEGDGDRADGGHEPSCPSPRKGSDADCSEDPEAEPPPVIVRKVSFADAFGLDLVSVKEFDSWNVPELSARSPPENDRGDPAGYLLLCLFTVPSSAEELMEKVADQKIELERVELLPETVSLRGSVRVMNLCFEKRVYVRTTLDGWDTHFDLAADFTPGSSDGETDAFSFTLSVAPPREADRCRVEFCLRYETVLGTFWANNGGRNYVMFCEKRGSRDANAAWQEGGSTRSMKSCLKANNICGVCLFQPFLFPQQSFHQLLSYVLLPGQMDWQTPQRNRRRAARMARVQNPFLWRAAEHVSRTEDLLWSPFNVDGQLLEGALSSVTVEDGMYATAVEMESPPGEFWDVLSFHAATDAGQAYWANKRTVESPESWCAGLTECRPWDGSSPEEAAPQVMHTSQQHSEASSGRTMEVGEGRHPGAGVSRSVVQLEHAVGSTATGVLMGAEVGAQGDQETPQAPAPQCSEHREGQMRLTDRESHKEESYVPEADDSKMRTKEERTFTPELCDASGGDGASLGGCGVSSIQTESQECGPETHSMTSAQEALPEEKCADGEETKVLRENDGKQELMAKDVGEVQEEVEKEQIVRGMKEEPVRNCAEEEGTGRQCRRESQREVLVSGGTDTSCYAGQETLFMAKSDGFFSTAREESSQGGQGPRRELASSAAAEKTEGSSSEPSKFSPQHQCAAEAPGLGSREGRRVPVRSRALRVALVGSSDDGEEAEVQPPPDAPGQPTPVKRAESAAEGCLWSWSGLTSSTRISRLLLYILLFAVICAAAYQYGFLACLALYLFSASLLFCHEHKQDLQERDRIDSQ